MKKELKWLIPLLSVTALSAIAQYFLFNQTAEGHMGFEISKFSLWISVLLIFSIASIKKKWVLAGNLGIIILLVVAVEIGFFFISGTPFFPPKNFGVPNLPTDHIGHHLGHVPWADSVRHDLKTHGSDTIYDAHYSIDKKYKRITPEYDSSKLKYAAFFGCSVAFGFGLDDNQTLPFQFQQKSDDYNAYNFAYQGWGMHHMLARLDHRNLSEDVIEKDGIGVYVFLWSHIRRAICDMRVYTEWGHTMPYYQLQGDELVRNGNFKTGRKYISKLYELLNRSYTIRHLNINLPYNTNERHYQLAVRIILEAKKRYTEQFGNDNFYVLIHPIDWTDFTEERKLRFMELLTEQGIEHFDYSQTIPLDNDHVIVGDGHPNELAFSKLADLLTKDIASSTANQ